MDMPSCPPDVPIDSSCSGPTFTITDFVVGPNFDAQSLKEALYSAGPVAVSIQADVPTFR